MYEKVWEKVQSKVGGYYEANKRLNQKWKQINDCCDNDRIACESNIEEMKIYIEQRKSGCCGSFDKSFKSNKDSLTYWYGFNYGH